MQDEISARRWTNNTDTNAHKPIDALKAMVRDVEAGKHSPKHIIITFVDEDGTLGWYQAGSFDEWASVGMLHNAAHHMIADFD
jgi:hypothetical protein